MKASRRRAMVIHKELLYFCVTVSLFMETKVEAYKSGCSGSYCFVVTDIRNANEFLTQSNAQQRCSANRTQLVEITGEDIQNSLVNFIRTQDLNNWNVFTNGKRSSDNWIRLSGVGIGGTIEVKEQPNAPDAYGYLKSTNSGFDIFASRPADTKEGYICTNTSSCSGGVTISGQCYISYAETLSFYNARIKCLNGGGDLASFDSITSNVGFNALNGSWLNPLYRYWVGIRREWWTWQTSMSDVKYSDWMTGHPINDHGNTDCLCLSTTQWQWTECGCSQALPFVCISGNNLTTTSTTKTSTTTTTTTTTTSTTTSSSPSTTTRSTTSTASRSSSTSNPKSSVYFESSGISSPTIPATVTSNSTMTVNETEVTKQSMGLSKEATIGIGVGVGVGGALVIVALIAIVVVLYRKRCPFRCPKWKPQTHAKLHTPDILMKDSANNHHSSDGMENPYAQIVPSSPAIDGADAYENSGQKPIIYATLGFNTEPQINRHGSVTIVPGKSKPFPAHIPANNNAANVGGDIYAEVTKA